ncbi:conserved protein of unknown function [Streptomyces sp. KY75]|uniref:Uncharacterized protein n=1 Tax=Streptomyces arboris TaxID=2600619 RepID=A0A5N5EEG3_9ACTN|nr:hypothetical protein F5983_34810 [Streptomyces arboris]RDV46984.1 hypothetical protein DDV98_36170 [Streptomyces sp. IB2014 011-12]CAD5911603.1 conserved protein of unknown function [Streptomyces sp. KY75]CAD5995065.1 conserved protein of unknown function [Streptomyces sp. KY70]
MTTTTRPATRVSDRTAPPLPAPPDEPIFAALAAHWRAAGRVVPGQADREWVTLAGTYPWPPR